MNRPETPLPLEPLLRIEDLVRDLNCSRRAVERLKSAGKLPRPDVVLGRCPRWKPETVRAFLEGGGRP